MKKEIWGFNVIGPQGLDARNDFAVGPNDEGDDVILRVNQAELTGKEFATLKEIAEGGPTPGGGGFPEQDLDDPTFVPEANHYYKQKAGEKPAPVMTAIKIGDVFDFGNKIHFDTTKEAELKTYLGSIDWQQLQRGGLLLAADANDRKILIFARNIGKETPIYIIMANSADDTEQSPISRKILYNSESMQIDEQGTMLEAGFHNLDDNGDYELVSPIFDSDDLPLTIDTIEPENAAWNGTMIGVMEEAPESQFIDGVIYFYDGEEYHAITGEGDEGTLDYNKLENVPIINLTENKTTVLLPFENGDILNGQSKIHFDTTKVDEFADYLNSLVYLEHMPMVPFFIGIKDQSSLRLMAAASKSPDSKSPEFNIPIFSVGLFAGSHIIVFAADDIYDAETGEKVYSKGFQNLDEDGNLLLDGISGDYVLELFPGQESNVDPADWNNIFISNVAEQTVLEPQPEDGEFYKRNGQIYKYTAAKPGELEAFEVGQTLVQGGKIHFDTTKGDELAEYLRGLEYDKYSGHVFMDCGGKFKIDASNPADNVYVLALTDMGGSSQNFPILYATDVIEAFEVTTPGFQYGEHELDNNGDYTLLAGYTITTINDTTPPIWNGVICGTIGEAQPELYDKVVLESELNGTTIVDLGSIEIDGESKEWDITKAQYDRCFGDNAIVKVNIANEGGIDLYAYKTMQMVEHGESRLAFMGMASDQQFRIEIGSDDPGEYMAYLELIEPDHLYRHDITIDCTAPDVFKVYLSVVYYNDNQVSTLSYLNNLIGSGHDYPVSGYYNNLSTGLKPAICVNTASNSVSMKYIDGASEYSATCDEKSTFTITDSVTTLAK